MVATVGDPVDPVIIHMSKARAAELASSYEEEKPALLLALDWQGPTAQLSAYQCVLRANLYVKLFRVAHMTLSLFANDWIIGKAPSSSIRAKGVYHATRLLMNWRKQQPPPPIRRHDPSHLQARKTSSGAPSPIFRPTGPHWSRCTTISPGSQTASQVLFS